MLDIDLTQTTSSQMNNSPMRVELGVAQLVNSPVSHLAAHDSTPMYASQFPLFKVIFPFLAPFAYRIL